MTNHSSQLPLFVSKVFSEQKLVVSAQRQKVQNPLKKKGKKQYQYESWNDKLRKQSRCRILAEAQPFEGLKLGLEFILSLSLQCMYSM